MRLLHAAGLNYEVIEAIDGLVTLCPLASHAMDGLLNTEAACYLSHLAAMRRMLDLGLEKAVIFEDDFAWVDVGAPQRFLEVWDHLPESFGCVKLDHIFRPDPGWMLGRTGPIDWMRELAVGSPGYIISAELARCILLEEPLPCQPIDNLIAEMTCRQGAPPSGRSHTPIVTVRRVPSLIDQGELAERRCDPPCRALVGWGGPFDPMLANTLANFFLAERAVCVADFACGLGDMVDIWQGAGLVAQGYDSDDFTAAQTAMKCTCEPIDLPGLDLGRSFDWGVALDVGHHLDAAFEHSFVENLVRHCEHGVVLSWACTEPGGSPIRPFPLGRNLRDAGEVSKYFAPWHFFRDHEAETVLRSAVSKPAPWRQLCLYVFRRDTSHSKPAIR